MHWRFWIALLGILIVAIIILIALNATVIVSIAAVVGVGIGSLTLFYTLERVPAIEFNGFTRRGPMPLQHGERAGWYATTYSIRVRKTKGLGKAEECEGFVSLINSPLINMRSIWVPDNVVRSDIGGQMEFIVFQTIKHTNEIIFSTISLQNDIVSHAFPLEPHLDMILSIEVHSKNAKTPQPLRRTVREIINEARVF